MLRFRIFRNAVLAASFLVGVASAQFNWSDTSVTTGDFSAVAWGNGIFVTSGDENGVFTSSDGILWTIHGRPSSYPIDCITWTGSLFIATALDDNTEDVFSSPDGASWTLKYSFSADGNTRISHMISTPTLIVAISDSCYAYTSPNGDTWTRHTVDSTISLTSIVWTGSQLIASGYTYPPSSGDTGKIFTSPDGIIWTLRWSKQSSFPSAFVCAGNKAIMDDGSGLQSSTDGITWTPIPLGNYIPFNFMSYVDSTLIGVSTSSSYNGSNFSEEIRINTSKDGQTWLNSFDSTSDNSYMLKDIAFSESRIVVVGNTGIILSTPRASNPIITTTPRLALGGVGISAVSSADKNLSLSVHGFKSGSSMNCRIFDMTGRCVKALGTTVSSRIELSVDGLAAGGYFLRAEANGIKADCPFVIE